MSMSKSISSHQQHWQHRTSPTPRTTRRNSKRISAPPLSSYLEFIDTLIHAVSFHTNDQSQSEVTVITTAIMEYSCVGLSFLIGYSGGLTLLPHNWTITDVPIPRRYREKRNPKLKNHFSFAICRIIGSVLLFPVLFIPRMNLSGALFCLVGLSLVSCCVTLDRKKRLIILNFCHTWRCRSSSLFLVRLNFALILWMLLCGLSWFCEDVLFAQAIFIWSISRFRVPTSRGNWVIGFVTSTS